MILPKSIKSRVNQMAHRSAQRHAMAVRDELLAMLQRIADNGASVADVSATLDAMEAGAIEISDTPFLEIVGFPSQL